MHITTLVLLTIVILVVAGLTAWAIKLWLEVFHNRASARQTNEQHQQFLCSSLTILARCLVQQQINMTEGCIRIKTILDMLDSKLFKTDKYQVFTTMYDATIHMPIGEARKILKARERNHLDKERDSLEKSLEGSIQLGHY